MSEAEPGRPTRRTVVQVREPRECPICRRERDRFRDVLCASCNHSLIRESRCAGLDPLALALWAAKRSQLFSDVRERAAVAEAESRARAKARKLTTRIREETPCPSKASVTATASTRSAFQDSSRPSESAWSKFLRR